MPTIEQLNYRHADHVKNSSYWELLDAVVCGGSKMTFDMKKRLLPNPDGRPAEVMDERVKLAAYVSKISPILTRFNAQLFAKDAIYTGSTDPYWSEVFQTSGGLLDGDDDSRASFKTLLMEAMRIALSTGKAIAQVDTRQNSGIASSRASQDLLKELEPYVVLHPRSALWDWKSNIEGFSFVKLHRFNMVRERWDEPPIPEHDFTIYQRQTDGRITASRHTVRKRLKDGEKQPTEIFSLDNLKTDEVEINTVLAESNIFSYGGKYEMPVLTLTLPNALQLGDQLFDLQKSYFTQTAALDWGIYTNNYAMPVVSGVDDEDDDPADNQKFGDGYYLTLKTGQSIGWTERPGGSFTTAISYRAEIKRDIYDSMQQIAMSASDGTSIVARSGESKKEDRRMESLLLSRYGQLVREFATQILNASAIAHGESVTWNVVGFDDFLDAGLTEDITDFQGVQGASVPSTTFKRAIAKYLISLAGKSMNLDDKDLTTSLREIDQAKDEAFNPTTTPAPPQ